MRETLREQGREHEKALYRYAQAFERGDLNTIIEVLRQAEQDTALGEMIMQLHEGYMEEKAQPDMIPSMLQNVSRTGTSSRGARPTPDMSGASIRKRGSKRLRRVPAFLQAMAAVLIVSLLVGGFFALFASRSKTGQGGHGWCIVTSPQPGSVLMTLQGIAAVSARNVWAVGSFDNESPNQVQSLIEHWDGVQWRQVATPALDRAPELKAVSVVSATDIWTVGDLQQGNAQSGKAYSVALVEHWDGRQWSRVPSPDAPGRGLYAQSLNAVSALSGNDVWMVGSVTNLGLHGHDQTLIEHWDGKQVKIIPSPNPDAIQNDLYSVTAIAANDVWAVGGRGNAPFSPLIEHWDGRVWSVVSSPPAHTILNAVSALSARDSWAVGGADPAYGNGALIEHWDGTQWKIVAGAVPGQGVTYGFAGVDAVSAQNVWVVGRVDNGAQWGRPLIEHWDGSHWSIVASAAPGGTHVFSRLVGVTGSDQGVWGVGDVSYVNNGTMQALIETPCR